MKSTSILIVEDERIIAQDIKRILTNIGFTVSAILISAEMVLQKIVELEPDLILMDIKLKGDMNGIEAAGQINDLFDVPVIYMTANADKDTIDKAKKTEPYGFIYKPVQPELLRAVIDMAIYKHRMEAQHREKEAWLNATLNSIGDAVIATDKMGTITFLNPVAEDLTGWKQSECQGLPLAEVFRILNTITTKSIANPVVKILENGTTVGLANNSVLISKNGVEIQIANSASPIHDDKGKITGAVLVFRDVTKEYRIQEALQESEERFHRLADNAKDMIYRMSLPDGHYEYVSPASVVLTGYTPAEFCESHLLLKKTIHPDWQYYLEEQWRLLLAGDVPPFYEFQVIHKSGETRWMHQRNTLICDDQGEPVAIEGIVTDVTERKQTEEELKKFKYALDFSSDAIVMSTPRGIHYYQNKTFNTMFGDIGSNAPTSIYVDENIGREVFNTIMGGDDWIGEVEMYAFNKTILDIFLHAYPVKKDGKVVALVGVHTNITERKRAEAALRLSEEQLRLITENTSDNIGIITFDLKATYTYVNPSVKSLLGYEPEDLLGKSFFDFIHPDDKKVLLPLLKKYVNLKIKKFMSGKENPISEKIEFRFRNKIGNWRFMESTVNIAGKQLLAVTRDITERKLAEIKEQVQIQNIKMLSDSAMQFVDFPAGENIYRFIAHMISEYVGSNAYVLVSSIIDDITLTTEAVVGIDKHAGQLIKLLGRNPEGNVLNITGTELDYLRNGKMHRNQKDLYGICLGTIPKVICESIEKLINLGDIYTAGIVKDRQLLGTIIILMKKNKSELINIVFLETFIKQAAIAIQKRQAERALIESEEKHRKLIETTSEGFWLIGSGGKTIDVNQSLCDMLGYSLDAMIGRSPLDFVDEVNREILTEQIMLSKDTKYRAYEITLKKKNGTICQTLFNATSLTDENDEHAGSFAFITDITDRKQAEEQIQRDLKEKEILLKEVHHRVKNNLNVITSLLNIQSHMIENKEQAVKAFKESRNRIFSMALVHEQLYKSSDYSQIDMRPYIENLSNQLRHICVSGKDINMNLKIKDVFLNVNYAIPCGLILNELVTNAYKHAFTNRKNGYIKISFRHVQPNVYSLIVEDDGIGLPEEIDIQNSKTLGLKLVSILTEQIGGMLEIQRNKGAWFSIRFSVDK